MYNQQPEMPKLEGHLSYLLWIKRPEWTVFEAILIQLGLDPNHAPQELVFSLTERPDIIPWWEGPYTKDMTDFSSYTGDRQFIQLLALAKNDLHAKKISNFMPSDRWVRWFIDQGLSIELDFWKAVCIQYPNFPYEATMRLDGRMDDFALRGVENQMAQTKNQPNTTFYISNFHAHNVQTGDNSIISAPISLDHSNTHDLVEVLQKIKKQLESMEGSTALPRTNAMKTVQECIDSLGKTRPDPIKVGDLLRNSATLIQTIGSLKPFYATLKGITDSLGIPLL